MNTVGVKFLLEHQHYLLVTMPQDQVPRYMDTWRKAWIEGRHAFLSGTSIVENGDPVDWTVITSRVLAIHTVSLNMLAMQSQAEQGLIAHGSGYVPAFGGEG